MPASVFVFRVFGLPDYAAEGWAALSSQSHLCVVAGRAEAFGRTALSAADWARIERELADSLPTRLLPASSAIYQALVPAAARESMAVQYVACLPARHVATEDALATCLARFRGER